MIEVDGSEVASQLVDRPESVDLEVGSGAVLARALTRFQEGGAKGKVLGPPETGSYMPHGRWLGSVDNLGVKDVRDDLGSSCGFADVVAVGYIELKPAHPRTNSAAADLTASRLQLHPDQIHPVPGQEEVQRRDLRASRKIGAAQSRWIDGSKVPTTPSADRPDVRDYALGLNTPPD
jgi:hypothetical protein